MVSSTLYDQLIDQYKLQAHIAQTSVTDLFRAFDVDENRAVVVEILLPNFSRQYSNRFVERMKTTAQLHHPNIAKIHQVGIAPNDRPYIARELIEGYQLSDHLDQLLLQPEPVNSIYVLKLIRQIAEALALAERLDLYHHHLSPQNIMLKSDGTIVLVDLGVPIASNGTVRRTRYGEDKEQAYLSPEQDQDKPIDSRSNIYSMGVVLYELLTRELPPAQHSYWQTARNIISPQRTPLEQARPGLSRELYYLVDRCLRRPPWSRFQTIERFIEAIDDALQAERMLIQDNGEPETPTYSSVRRPKLYLPFPLLLMIVLSVLIVLSIQLRGLLGDENGGAQIQNQIQNSTGESVVLPVIAPTQVANLTAMVVSTETAVPQTVQIEILTPGEDGVFERGGSVTFSWFWPFALEPEQQFAVYLRTDQYSLLLGTVAQSDNNMTHSLETSIPTNLTTGTHQWLIMLEDTVSNRQIAESRPRRIEIVAKPATPTQAFTPAPTGTPTSMQPPSSTPTPLPQVRVIVSSASLRSGPGVQYTIIRFLYDGDIVPVIAKSSESSEWYVVTMEDGTTGWLAASVSEAIYESAMTAVPIAATIPPLPTPTNTATPTITPTPPPTPVPSSGGDPRPTRPAAPPTLTPPPPP